MFNILFLTIFELIKPSISKQSYFYFYFFLLSLLPQISNKLNICTTIARYKKQERNKIKRLQSQSFVPYDIYHIYPYNKEVSEWNIHSRPKRHQIKYKYLLNTTNQKLFPKYIYPPSFIDILKTKHINYIQNFEKNLSIQYMYYQ